MTTQLALELPVEPPPMNDLERRYRVWRAEHPATLALFRRFAREMLRHNRRFGIWLLANRVRWEVFTQIAKDADGYRINNNLLAYLARDLIRTMPELAPLLETRRVRSTDVEREDAL